MRAFLTTILLITALSIYSNAQEALTLEKAIGTALENNYSIKIAENDQKIIENNFTRGNAGFLPTVTADYNRTYGVQNFEQQLASGNENTGKGVQNKRESYGAALNWTIFDGLKMFTTYDKLSELNNQSEDIVRANIELLVFQITSAFYDAALEKERLQLFKSNVGLSEERLRIAKDKYELGRASKIEYLQAQVDLNSDKSSMIKQMEILTIRKLDLMRLMALEGDTINFIIQYSLVNDQQLQLPELLNRLETDNPQLLALKKEQVIALYDEKITRGDRLPEVGLFAEYTHTNFDLPSGGFVVGGKSDALTYGLTARWTIFNGFNINRQIENTKIQHQSAIYRYEDQLLEYNTNIKRRYVNYSNNIELLALEVENMEVARENNEIAQERYEIGLSNALEIREAQINLINAELRLQNAAFAAKQAEIELKFLAGILMR